MKIKNKLLGLRDHVYTDQRSLGDHYGECSGCGCVVVRRKKTLELHAKVCPGRG